MALGDTNTVTFAKVQLTVEVETSNWGDSCTTGQVFKQSSEEALNAVQKVLQGSKVRVLGVAKVESVTVRKDR